MKIVESTFVDYPAGAVSGTSQLVAVVEMPSGTGVITAATPFHPLDHTWPDQPADTGTLRAGGPEPVAVTDCLTGAVEHGTSTLHVGADIPVRRGEPGWHWLVVHLTPARTADLGAEGAPVELAVDAAARAALSAGHTACHLAALALNEALAGRWRKQVRADSLGRPDFDQSAITESRILPCGSRDTYRLGKSLRKKGFGSGGLAEELDQVAAQVNRRLAAWVAADAPVGVHSPGPELTARRSWHCSLPEGEAGIPCGGTHVTSTGRLGSVHVRLDLSADGTALTMHTTTAAPAGVPGALGPIG